MRAAKIVAMSILVGMVGGCCTPWRDVTIGESQRRAYEPWVGPGERGRFQHSDCYFWVANLVGIAALPNHRMRFKAPDGRAISTESLVSAGVFSEADSRSMLNAEFAEEWSGALASNDAWMAEHPEIPVDPPHIYFYTHGVLVAIDPLVWIARTRPYAAGPGIRYRDDRLVGPDVAATPRALPEVSPASFVLQMRPLVGYSGHLLDVAQFSHNDTLFWIIGGAPNASTRRLNPSDPETMRVKTDWGWLIASFDEEGALQVDGVAELPADASK